MRPNVDVQDFFERIWLTREGFRSNCPRCDDRSQRFYYNTEKRVGCCFHHGCLWYKEVGGVTEKRLLAWFGHLGVTPGAPMIIEQSADIETKLPDEFRQLDDLDDELRIELEEYLTGIRGLSIKAVNRAKIGYCEDGRWWGYLIVPVFDDDGLVCYWQARRYKNREPKFYNPQSSRKSKLLYTIDTRSQPRRLVIVESVFNALTLFDLEDTVTVAILGHDMSPEQREKLFWYERRLEEIVIMLDPDAWRDAVKLATTLCTPKDYKVKLVRVPKGTDANSLGFHQSEHLIDEAKVFTRDKKMKFMSGEIYA